MKTFVALIEVSESIYSGNGGDDSNTEIHIIDAEYKRETHRDIYHDFNTLDEYYSGITL